MVPCRSEYEHSKVLDGQSVPRPYGEALVRGDGLLIRCVVFSRHLRIFEIGTVVHKCANVNLRCELRHSSYVVSMEVSDKNIIEFAESRSLGCRDDAIGISPVEARPPGINQ